MSTKSPRRPWQSSMIGADELGGHEDAGGDERLLDALDVRRVGHLRGVAHHGHGPFVR